MELVCEIGPFYITKSLDIDVIQQYTDCSFSCLMISLSIVSCSFPVAMNRNHGAEKKEEEKSTQLSVKTPSTNYP